MSTIVLIREAKPSEFSYIAEVVRNAYTSNIYNSWLNIVCSEITFQLTTLVSAYLFIFMNVSIRYCLISIPIVFVFLYVIIYGSVLMKTAELLNSKKPIKSWVAEVIEPLFSNLSPEDMKYKIISNENVMDDINLINTKRKIIGTVSVMGNYKREDWAWLFRLGVDKKYRRKGIGLALTQTVKNWCKTNKYDNLELAITDCQSGARELFAKAGFELGQMYHQKLFTSWFTLQMFQLRCEIRPIF